MSFAKKNVYYVSKALNYMKLYLLSKIIIVDVFIIATKITTTFVIREYSGTNFKMLLLAYR